MYELARDELPRVRTAAVAWRNGVGALLVGLIGFGLIKGRTDVSQLASPYDLIVGVLLLCSLALGITAAMLILRAAHGRPASVVFRREGQDLDPGSRLASDHSEAQIAARLLFQGLVLSLVCVAFLVTAVGMTWYGPSEGRPRIEIQGPDGTHCGKVLRLTDRRLTLRTDHGEVAVDLQSLEVLKAVDSCSSRQP
ncbi:hypothetical protein [Streptomyces caniscabiei]|uniref:hypothetical protein n=1 Tax=Streptomyces caniscabiei TaxID=2746961 RepID=UPI000AE732F4|nr:hypothetical protein [Streptomyces caniscabiei]